jgi:hypothetical protein
MPETYTYTFTKARLELVVDEFEALLLRAGCSETAAAAIAEGVRKRMCLAVVLRAGRRDGSGVFIVDREVRLAVDWDSFDEALSRGEDTVALDEHAWQGGVSPETRVHVRRFRQAVEDQRLDWRVGVQLAAEFKTGTRREEADKLMRLRDSSSHKWRGPRQELESRLEEVPELTYMISVVEDPE